MTKMPHANRSTLFLVPLTAAVLAAPGCYDGVEALEFADARVPVVMDHEEMFGGYLPAPPPTADIDEGSDQFTDVDEGPEAIYGGTTVPVCGWPSTVELGGACSGTLVHPQVVIYASHCGASYSPRRPSPRALARSSPAATRAAATTSRCANCRPRSPMSRSRRS